MFFSSFCGISWIQILCVCISWRLVRRFVFLGWCWWEDFLCLYFFAGQICICFSHFVAFLACQISCIFISLVRRFVFLGRCWWEEDWPLELPIHRRPQQSIYSLPPFFKSPSGFQKEQHFRMWLKYNAYTCPTLMSHFSLKQNRNFFIK